jgi:hypothetical protein
MLSPVHHKAHAAILASHRKLLQGDDSVVWSHATSCEFGRLAQGLTGQVEGTDTIFFLPHASKPPDKRATYPRFVCAHKPLKPDPYRVRVTAGGDKIEYPGNVATPTVDTTTVMLLLNSVLSTPKARFMSLDLHNFYLGTPLPNFEYMRIPLSSIPMDIIKQYNLHDIAQDGFVMTEIRKGIYGLPQAGILANLLLIERLAKGGYHPAPHTPGLFLHDTNGVAFSLHVDDFGIKYVDQASAQHLIDLLDEHYDLEVDWTGKNYLGLTLEWNYEQRTVVKSMPGYIERALERFGIDSPPIQHSPHAWIPPIYGPGAQFEPTTPESPPLPDNDIKKLQQIIGVLLYYARMVDSTMLVALGTLSSAQSKGTQATMDAAIHLLNYAATHPDAAILYTASDMVLHVTSDASYLSVPGSRSRCGGYFYMSSAIGPIAPLPSDPAPPFNGAILVHSSIIKAIMSSAAEAETGALFYNAKDACLLRTTLLDLGHPQPATPIQTDNACAMGIVNETVKQRRSKAMDMRFYWVRDRVRAGEFIIYWKQGSDNDADYFTKTHSPSHHRKIRPRYLHQRANKTSCEGVLIQQ